MILFLDDSKERTKAFKSKVPSAKTVKTTKACIKALSKEDAEWDIVFLDHDLGGEQFVDTNREDCGMEVVRWIVANEPFIRQIIVHSHNGPAAKEMCSKLNDAMYQVVVIPFASLLSRIEGIAND